MLIFGASLLFALSKLWADPILHGELVVLTLTVEMTQYPMEDFPMLPRAVHT